MIYSRWRPDKGGYDYFETSERYGLGDDLPVPTLTGGTGIGVPSVTAGRMPPAGALRLVGSGKYARGMIMPTSREGLEGAGAIALPSVWVMLGASAAAGIALGVFLKRKAA